jgi:hypothetical protein
MRKENGEDWLRRGMTIGWKKKEEGYKEMQAGCEEGWIGWQKEEEGYREKREGGRKLAARRAIDGWQKEEEGYREKREGGRKLAARRAG